MTNSDPTGLSSLGSFGSFVNDTFNPITAATDAWHAAQNAWQVCHGGKGSCALAITTAALATVNAALVISPYAILGRAALGIGLRLAARVAERYTVDVYAMTAAKAAMGPARSTDDLLRSFGSLSAGRQKYVKTVSSEAELRQTFDAWVVGAQRLQPHGPKVPDVYQLPDGTVIQWRTESDTGSATIDIFTGAGRPRKVHVE